GSDAGVEAQGADAMADAPDFTPGCPTGETVCGSMSVDLQINSNNCGACNVPCSAGTQCAGGQCRCNATSGCDGCCNGPTSCTPLGASQDSVTCGHGGNACAGCGALACDTSNGTCVCPGGQTQCGGSCVDTTGDQNN